MMAAATEPVYDSARARSRGRDLAGTVWSSRGLLSLLVRRDLAGRYKRSIFGMWWTLMNPLLEMVVLLAVFSNVFRTSDPRVPYVVYLLSGLILMTLFRQTVTGVASSIINNELILSKLYVAPEVFAASAVFVLLVNLTLSLIPLLIIMIAMGTPVPASLPLVVVPILVTAGLASGVGLLLAPAATRFPDILDLTQITLLLFTYATPVFYPVRIIPGAFADIEQANPLYHALRMFRALLYGGPHADGLDYAVLLAVAALALTAGAMSFSRGARRAIALL